MNQSAIQQAFDQFSSLKIAVIGDVILDAYFRGSVHRISPEAPVPILDVQHKEYRLGGAANVALNVCGLGATPILCSVIGADEAGGKVLELLEAEGVSTAGMVRSTERTTSLKTRMMSGHHQLLRMDEEQSDAIQRKDEQQLYEAIEAVVRTEQPDAIIFEDYDKGTLTGTVISNVLALAHELHIPTAVDPKRRNFLSYSGCTLFKPNLRELRDGLNQSDLKTDETSMLNAYRLLQDIMPVEFAFFTLSSDGVFMTDGKQHIHLPAEKRTIADVSGAGDTVISVAACALAAGLEMQEIAFISNIAGGWVCQFPGVVAIEADALNQEVVKMLQKP